MTEHPILISSGSDVRAILDGRKTETRRPVTTRVSDIGRVETGDVLWVRERWATEARLDDLAPLKIPLVSPPKVFYDADGRLPSWGKDRPSIHMPKWASRIRLLVTEVRAERLQEIDAHGALAEGIEGDLSAHTVADFARLWDSTYSGEQAWAANPWVWVWRFEMK